MSARGERSAEVSHAGSGEYEHEYSEEHDKGSNIDYSFCFLVKYVVENIDTDVNTELKAIGQRQHDHSSEKKRYGLIGPQRRRSENAAHENLRHYQKHYKNAQISSKHADGLNDPVDRF